MEHSENPVLIAPADNLMALAVIRSLGRKGVETIGVTRSAEGVGKHSRYCREVIPVSSSPEGVVTAVLNLASQYRASHLIATNENFIVLLNEYRSRLESRIRLLFPPKNIFDVALHKDETIRVAAASGIPVPRTEEIRGIDDLAKCASMRFPLVLKPPHGDIGSVLKFRALYINSYQQLRDEVMSLGTAGEYPLIQEYWNGVGIGVEVLMCNGSPMMIFQHRRLREYPITGGASVYCESMPLNGKLVDYSVALLKAMHWEGVAMVEFKFNETTGEAALMEVNGRFWGSLPLALHAGADFPYALYLSSLGAAIPKVAYDRVVRCRSLAGDTKWLLATLRNGDSSKLRAIAAYLAAFKPNTRYFIWAADDPKPAVFQLLRRLRTTVSKALRVLFSALPKPQRTT
jgi:predicted ATP-grasp superfamily ATP-dependent carboligase